MKRKQTIKMLLIATALTFVGGATMAKNAVEAYANEKPVSMNAAAAIRTEDPNGIRFYGQITDDCKEAITQETTMGVKVSFTYNEVDYSEEKTVDLAKLYQKEGVWTYNAVIAGLPEDAYNMDISVQAFVQMTANGEKVYSEATTTHSIAYIAGQAKKNGEIGTFYDTVINKASENFILSDSAVTLKVGGEKQITYSGTAVKYVQYEIEDDTIASIDDTGKITAIKAGSTTLTVTIGNNTQTCAITVSAPVNLGELGDVQLSRDDTTNEVGTSFDATSLMTALTKKSAEATIQTVKQIVNGETKELTYDADTNTLSGAVAGVSTIVLTDNVGNEYTATLHVCTLIIKTKTDLSLMTTILEANKVRTGGNASGEIPTFTSGGYFVLGANITWSSGFKSNFILSASYAEVDNNGFTGTFDGRGYTISGLLMQANTDTDTTTGQALHSVGLFTYIAESGVVKNVKIQGVAATSNEKSAILAHVIEGKVQNVNIVYYVANRTPTISNTGILCCRATNSAVFENIVVDISQLAFKHNGNNWGLLWAYTDLDGLTMVKGVYVIGGATAVMQSSGKVWCGAEAQNSATVSAMSRTGHEGAYFSSADNFTNGLETTAFVADGSAYAETTAEHNAWTYINANFSADIWDLSGAIPTLKAKN